MKPYAPAGYESDMPAFGRTLSDEELATYVEFSESDAGRWFVGAQRKGLLDAMRAAMDSAARQMAGAFPAKR